MVNSFFYGDVSLLRVGFVTCRAIVLYRDNKESVGKSSGNRFYSEMIF